MRCIYKACSCVNPKRQRYSLLLVSCFVPVYEHAALAAARPAVTAARREDNSMVPAATRAHKPQMKVSDRSAATALHLHICTTT
jgi:hypothetical protein